MITQSEAHFTKARDVLLSSSVKDVRIEFHTSMKLLLQVKNSKRHFAKIVLFRLERLKIKSTKLKFLTLALMSLSKNNKSQSFPIRKKSIKKMKLMSKSPHHI